MKTVEQLIDKYSAELVEELMEASAKNGSDPWFIIVRRKMRDLSATQEQLRIRESWKGQNKAS